MSEISKPSDINKIWSSGGDVISPSDTKIATGWLQEIPPRQWFNWLDNKQDQAIAHINQHGIAVWDATTEYQAGKSYVQGSDGNIYKAIQTNTNQNPVTDTSFIYWSKSATGGLLNTQIFTVSGIYTPTPGTTYIVIEAIGGGGAGGGILALSSGQIAAAGGGASGAYGYKKISSGFSGVPITIGAGGSGVVGSSGGNGGTTSFGSLLSCPGGLGAPASSIATGAYVTGSPVTTSSNPVGADIGIRTIPGSIGVVLSSTSAKSGDGGNSYYGAPGGGGIVNGVSSAASGTSAGGYGSGGGGAIGTGISATGFAGGNGSSGILIIYEYC